MVDRNSPDYVHQLEMELTSLHSIVQGLKDILRSTRSPAAAAVSARTAALEQVLHVSRQLVTKLTDPRSRQVGSLEVKAAEDAIRLADALPPL